MNKSTISPYEFANKYLTTTEHKNCYKEKLKQEEFGFENFIKDTSLIDKK